MPLDVDIALINTIEGQDLAYTSLASDTSLETDDLVWTSPPPETLPPFQYHRCQCTGSSAGYQVALKYGPLICRIDITAWGVHFRKSVPTTHDLEVVLVKGTPPYRLEIILL
ncbi:hypothetical protein [Sneathiella chinensis]|uniref:Uncharacterized protein n=1 Tax=Sneathiella chinensis TaxID=349750 RepID=A0ABQ5U2M4_9PROT|nr:hypothetical protein [Sneathiella chinensis]GLQ06437.1 hypothetical protein GCM10007924_16580 [Sneathiella chinensis]